MNSNKIFVIDWLLRVDAVAPASIIWTLYSTKCGITFSSKVCKVSSSSFGQTWPRDISLSVTGPDKGAKHTVLCANNVSQSPAFICIHGNYEVE